MADEWVDLYHEETGGTTRVPNVPDVLAMHESRGWTVAVAPAEETRTVTVPAPGEEWVEMTHPDLPTGRQRVPNHPDAIAGQEATGWVIARDLSAEDADQATEPAEVKRREPKETPAADAGTDDPAGDGTNEKE